MIFDFLHNNVNKPVLILLNSFANNNIVGNIVYLMADLPIFIIPIFLIGFWIYKRNYINEKNKLLFIFYSCVLAILINITIQQFIYLDRPEKSIENVGRLILKHIPDVSFPSDHASVGIAFISSLLLFGFVKFGVILLPFFIIMLLSRIIGGIHWPFDIVVGSLIGIISTFLIYKFQNICININKLFLKIMSFL